MMFFKNSKTREFKYNPRFYKPTSEDDENEKRIKFRKLRRARSVPRRSMVAKIIIIIVLLFLIRYLFKTAFEDEKNAPIEQLKIEIID